jgi:hypothetical protein
MGLTMSPMSTAAMNAVAVDKAGVASGILSMSRMVGGTFGVAVTGALFQSISRNRLTDTLGSVPLTPGQRASVIDQVSSGTGGAVHGVPAAAAARVHQAANDAFIHSLSTSILVATGVAVLGVIAAVLLIEPKKPSPARHERELAAHPEAVAVEEMAA